MQSKPLSQKFIAVNEKNHPTCITELLTARVCGEIMLLGTLAYRKDTKQWSMVVSEKNAGISQLSTD